MSKKSGKGPQGFVEEGKVLAWCEGRPEGFYRFEEFKLNHREWVRKQNEERERREAFLGGAFLGFARGGLIRGRFHPGGRTRGPWALAARLGGESVERPAAYGRRAPGVVHETVTVARSARRYGALDRKRF